MNRKGIIFMSLIVFLLFALLLYSYKVLVIDKELKQRIDYAGETSLRVYGLSGEADLKEFYIKQALKYSVYKALNKTAAEGGGCEYWNSCDFKDSIIDKSKELFFSYVTEFLVEYLEKVGLGEKEISYSLDFDGSYLNLIVDKLSLNLKTISGIGGFIERSFEYEYPVSFDFGIYGFLYDKVKNLRKCEDIKALENSFKKEYKIIGLECEDSNTKKHINIKIVTTDLEFVRPIIMFKLGEEAERLKRIS